MTLYDARLRWPIGCLYITGELNPSGWPPSKLWRYCQQPRRRGSRFCDKHHKKVWISTATKRAETILARQEKFISWMGKRHDRLDK